MLYLRLIIFSVVGDVSINSETFLMTDFINLKIKLTQSFRDAHKNKVRAHKNIVLKKSGKSLPAKSQTIPSKAAGVFFSVSCVCQSVWLSSTNPTSSLSPSASSPTLGSSPVHPHLRPPTIPQPRCRAPSPKRRPSSSKPAHAWNPFIPDDDINIRKSKPLHSDKLKPESLQ
jgi:hypothetical protein